MKHLTFLLSFAFFMQNLVAQNVGIGTETPQYKLDVAGRIRIKTGTLGNASTGSGLWMEDFRDGSNRMFFGMQDSIRAGFYGAGAGGVGWNFNFNAKTGFVGIGRTAANYRLEIDDATGASMGLYKGGNFAGRMAATDTTVEVYTRNGSSTCFPNPCPAANLVLVPPVPEFSFATPGNVGIGVNKPAQKISVNGAVGIYSGTSFIGSMGRSTSGNNLLINAAAGNSSTNTAPEDLILQNWTGNSATSGNVGIGTNAPLQKLEVNGNIRVKEGITKPATGQVNMLPFAYGLVGDDGKLLAHTNNFSAVRTSKGHYTVAIASETYLPEGQFIILATANSGPYMIKAELKAETKTIDVIVTKSAVHWMNSSDCGCPTSRITDGQFYDFEDSDFSMVIYKTYFDE